MKLITKAFMAASLATLLVGMSVGAAEAQYRRYGEDRYSNDSRYGSRYRDDNAYDDNDDSYTYRPRSSRGSTTNQYGERRADERYPMTTRGGTTDRRDRYRWED